MLLRCESLEPPMSQLGPNSAVSGFLRHGCFTPETGHCSARLGRQKSAGTGCERLQQGSPLLNHLVSAGEPCRWDPETYAPARWPPHP